MSTFEKTSVENDPGYDPERLSSKQELNQSNVDSSTTRHEIEIANHKKLLLLNLSIPEYTFLNGSNPYRFDNGSRESLEPIAKHIDACLRTYFGDKDILIRAVQSKKHKDMSRDTFVQFIAKNGLDYVASKDPSFYAVEYAPFSLDSTVVGVMEGFHKWKPKCEETPQDSLDIWMVFDSRRFEVVPHIHPIHKTLSKDKFQPTPSNSHASGLRAIIVIN